MGANHVISLTCLRNFGTTCEVLLGFWNLLSAISASWFVLIDGDRTLSTHKNTLEWCKYSTPIFILGHTMHLHVRRGKIAFLCDRHYLCSERFTFSGSISVYFVCVLSVRFVMTQDQSTNTRTVVAFLDA